LGSFTVGGIGTLIEDGVRVDFEVGFEVGFGGDEGAFECGDRDDEEEGGGIDLDEAVVGGWGS